MIRDLGLIDYPENPKAVYFPKLNFIAGWSNILQCSGTPTTPQLVFRLVKQCVSEK